MKTQENDDKEKMVIALQIAEDFGLPVIKGEIISRENEFGIEFGDVVINIAYPSSVPREKIASFVESVASFPEIFAQFGIDMINASEDFDKILLVLKILAELFSKRTGADDANINIATFDNSEDEINKTKEEHNENWI